MLKNTCQLILDNIQTMSKLFNTSEGITSFSKLSNRTEGIAAFDPNQYYHPSEIPLPVSTKSNPFPLDIYNFKVLRVNCLEEPPEIYISINLKALERQASIRSFYAEIEGENLENLFYSSTANQTA